MSGKVKNLYKSFGKCDAQLNYKAVLYSALLSTPKGITKNIPISPRQYVTVKKPSARK